SGGGQCASGTCYKVAGEVDFSNSQTDQAHVGNYIEIYGVFDAGTQGTVTLGSVNCPVSYWSTNQVNCQVGSSTPTGAQTLTVATAGAARPRRRIPVIGGGAGNACGVACRAGRG